MKSVAVRSGFALPERTYQKVLAAEDFIDHLQKPGRMEALEAE